jgi:outer membrane murein-binding lipoprotein Lpp
MNEQIMPPDAPPPTRVCAKCSVQTQTSGDYCPHCGNSYVARRRRLSRKAIIAIVASVVAALVLAGGAATAISLKAKQDREAAAAERREAAQAAAEKAEAARQERQEAKAAAEQAERDIRAQIIRQMQKSITKDAKERVGDGVLEGPIYYTTCDPLGGGSVDDLTALTTTFECIAVNEKLGGGQVRGWVFSATANWDEGSWSWQLGD